MVNAAPKVHYILKHNAFVTIGGLNGNHVVRDEQKTVENGVTKQLYGKYTQSEQFFS
jgi:hypothetical protein